MAKECQIEGKKKHSRLSFLEAASSSSSRVRTLRWGGWRKREIMISYQTSGAAAGLLTFLLRVRWFPTTRNICPDVPATSCSCGRAQLPAQFFPARLLSCSRSALTPPRVILGWKKRTPPNDLACVLLCLHGNAAAQMTTRPGNESTVRTSKEFQIGILPFRQRRHQ